MRGQPFCRAALDPPTETARTISRELHVVRRIRIYKIFGFNFQQCRIGAGKSPITNDLSRM